MKRLVTAVCVLAVAIGSVMAANLQSKMHTFNQGIAKEDPANINMPKGDWTSEQSNFFDLHWFGYGWYQGYNKKIAFDPISGAMGSSYRQKDFAADGTTAATGSVGAMGSFSSGFNTDWKDNMEKTTLAHTSTAFSGRYPSVAAADGYVFAVYNSSVPAPSKACFSVYDNETLEWSANTEISSNPEIAWCGVVDATKAADGTYYMLTSWEKDLTTTHNFSATVGSSKTPSDPASWNWTNASNLQFGQTLSGMASCSNKTQVAWGKDGFGILVTDGRRASDTSNKILYTYTTDYGQTWVKNGTDILFSIDVNPAFFGKVFTASTGPITLDNISFGAMDVVVDEDNMVHLAVQMWGSTTAGLDKYYPNTFYTDDKTNISGIYHIKSNDVNPAPSDWGIKLVAEQIGGRTGEEGSEPGTDTPLPEGAPDGSDTYSDPNSSAVSIGYAGRSTVYISWLDRPSDAFHVTQFVPAITVDAAKTRTTWASDAFFGISTDGGATWDLADNVQHRGYNLTNTKEVHEQGFTIARKARLHGSASPRDIETYAACQIWDPNMPQASGMSTVDPSEWQNKYYAYQIKGTAVGIGAEKVALFDKDFALEQNYPNPFNPTTAIEFNLKNEASVNLSVYNANGQMVSELVNSKMNSGLHTASFNASSLNSGVYFYKLTVDGQSAVKKMVLTK